MKRKGVRDMMSTCGFSSRGVGVSVYAKYVRAFHESKKPEFCSRIGPSLALRDSGAGNLSVR